MASPKGIWGMVRGAGSKLAGSQKELKALSKVGGLQIHKQIIPSSHPSAKNRPQKIWHAKQDVKKAVGGVPVRPGSSSISMDKAREDAEAAARKIKLEKAYHTEVAASRGPSHPANVAAANERSRIEAAAKQRAQKEIAELHAKDRATDLHAKQVRADALAAMKARDKAEYDRLREAKLARAAADKIAKGLKATRAAETIALKRKESGALLPFSGAPVKAGPAKHWQPTPKGTRFGAPKKPTAQDIRHAEQMAKEYDPKEHAAVAARAYRQRELHIRKTLQDEITLLRGKDPKEIQQRLQRKVDELNRVHGSKYGIQGDLGRESRIEIHDTGDSPHAGFGPVFEHDLGKQEAVAIERAHDARAAERQRELKAANEAASTSPMQARHASQLKAEAAADRASDVARTRHDSVAHHEIAMKAQADAARAAEAAGDHAQAKARREAAEHHQNLMRNPPKPDHRGSAMSEQASQIDRLGGRASRESGSGRSTMGIGAARREVRLAKKEAAWQARQGAEKPPSPKGIKALVSQKPATTTIGTSYKRTVPVLGGPSPKAREDWTGRQPPEHMRMSTINPGNRASGIATHASEKARTAHGSVAAQEAAAKAHRVAAETLKAHPPKTQTDSWGNPVRNSRDPDAGYHERQAAQHEAEAKGLVKREQRLHDTSGTTKHAKRVDDYEHSGDTEHEAERLGHAGANTGRLEDGRDDDGDKYGAVHYTLPKGVSRAQFDKVQEAQYLAQDYHANPAAKKHYDDARYAVRNGRGEEAAKHAQAAIDSAKELEEKRRIERNKKVLKGG